VCLENGLLGWAGLGWAGLGWAELVRKVYGKSHFAIMLSRMYQNIDYE